MFRVCQTCSTVCAGAARVLLSVQWERPTPLTSGTHTQAKQDTLCLRACLQRADVPDAGEQQALHDDILHTAQQYGQVTAVEVPAPLEDGEEDGEQDADDIWIGDVLIRYKTALAAQRASEALQGRYFGDAPLTAVVQTAAA